MTLDEAIKHCEEVAEENTKACDRNICFQNEYNNIECDECYIEGCNKCASEHRQLVEWLRELKRDREILDGLSVYFQSLVVDAAINQRPLMFDMRDATKEERESVKQYIADSAKTTGINFWSIIGEVNADADSN